MTLHLAGEEDTLAAGARLAAALEALPADARPADGVQIHLRGHLGAGKTTLVRGLLRALGVPGAVKSPTYTLVEPYAARGLDLYHFDLYRIGSEEELELIGAREHFRSGAVCLFEWPERGGSWLPDADLTLRLDAAERGRDLRATGRGALGERLARAVADGTDS